jgi:uncharacterized protein (TIGR02588 family)
LIGRSAARSDTERVTLVISFLVVAALIAAAVWEQSLRRESTEGDVSVTFDTAAAAGLRDGHHVPYTVTNTGAEAISEADLRFEVYDGDRVVDSADITVRLLPLRGTQDGVFVTKFDPASHDLRARLVSLQFP